MSDNRIDPNYLKEIEKPHEVRPIDANALMTEIARLVVGGKHAIEEAGHGNFWINGLYDVKKIIDNFPTIEPDKIQAIMSDYLVYRCEPQRPQGEWIKKVDDVGFISHICSNCGSEIEVEDPCDDKFCYSCGARMRGKEE